MYHITSTRFMNGYWYGLYALCRSCQRVSIYTHFVSYESFLHAVQWYRFIIGTMKGFVPSFHGSELCIAVIYIYIFHIMAQHLSRDFKIYKVFKMFFWLFLGGTQFSTYDIRRIEIVYSFMMKCCQYICISLCKYPLLWFILFSCISGMHFVQVGTYSLVNVLFCMNVCTISLNKYSTM